MKKIVLTLVLIFLWGIHLQAQPKAKAPTNKIHIIGSVIDGNDTPIPFASIAVYSVTDSSMVTGEASNFEGKFRIPVKAGDYYLKLSFLAYQEKMVDGVKVVDKDVDMGKITLEESAIALEAVEIEGEKSEMELKLDRRVFNVGKDLSNRGGNAVEILDNVPSVTVDIDGNVSLRGSENVRILVDGKPSGLVGSTTDALRQLQGNLIEQVEVITNPSARYDAEGEVGIINIVLKKQKKKGVNGSFDFNVGSPANHGVAYNLNFRRKKYNLFTNFGLSYNKMRGGGTTYQRYLNETILDSTGQATTWEVLDSERNHRRGGLSSNIQFGSDFFLNDQNTLTVSGLYKYGQNRNNASVIYNYLDDFGNALSVTNRSDQEKEPSQNAEAALRYKKTFDEKDRSFTFDFKYIQRDETESATYQENSTYYVNPPAENLPIEQRSTNTEDEITFLAQTDYVHPISKDGKIEAGLKASFRNIDNDFKVEELEENIWTVLPDFDDRLNYVENIYAAYLMAGNKKNRFSWQAGLRVEHSDIRTELVDSEQTNDRKYTNFFPSAHISYELNAANSLQVSYSRRLTRPRFWFLLPFFTFSDNRNLFSGNPNLDPEYTDSYELGFLRNFEQGSFLTTAYYRYRTGVIQRILISNGDGTTRRFPINLGTQNEYGLEMNLSYEPFDWWRMNLNFNGLRAITEGTYEGQTLFSDALTWNSRFSTKFKLPANFDLQTSFDYRAPAISPQGKRLSMYAWDAGISKDVLKNKGTISLSAKDILNSRKRRGITETDNFFSISEFQWRSRQILLSFNYRLNQQKKRGGRGGYGGGR